MAGGRPGGFGDVAPGRGRGGDGLAPERTVDVRSHEGRRRGREAVEGDEGDRGHWPGLAMDRTAPSLPWQSP